LACGQGACWRSIVWSIHDDDDEHATKVWEWSALMPGKSFFRNGALNTTESWSWKKSSHKTLSKSHIELRILYILWHHHSLRGLEVLSQILLTLLPTVSRSTVDQRKRWVKWQLVVLGFPMTDKRIKQYLPRTIYESEAIVSLFWNYWPNRILVSPNTRGEDSIQNLLKLKVRHLCVVELVTGNATRVPCFLRHSDNVKWQPSIGYGQPLPPTDVVTISCLCRIDSSGEW
jgi:hypothetical protein